MTYEITLELTGSMLEMEEQIQVAVNELGKAATRSALSEFDTNGEPVVVKGERHTAKQRAKKKSSALMGR